MECPCNIEESYLKLSQSDESEKKSDDSFITASSNWDIDNNKNLNDCISTSLLSEIPERTNLEDVVSLDTCVALKSDPFTEACKVEFKVKSKQKIARIAVVSEASVLEFFKQSGEYAATIFADFVDEFQDQAVYFAEATIQPPSTEASIKFTRTKNKGTTMWIYGIKLIVTEAKAENSKNSFDFDVINNLLSNGNELRPDRAEMAKRVLQSFSAGESSFFGDDMGACLQKLTTMNWKCGAFRSQDSIKSNNIHKPTLNHDSKEQSDILSQDKVELKSYIDDKFASLEKRLMEQIESINQKTNQKLDAILRKLDLNFND